MADILLKPGQHGIIIGQNGSGKSVGAIWLMQHIPIAPVIILDTKGEAAFDDVGRDDERVTEFDSGSEFVKNWKRDINSEYILVRPTSLEMSDPGEMDNILGEIYSKARPCLVYIDEAYQWHINGQAGAGLIGLLTRGRSKKISVLISSQRPAWISRFCYTECKRFYVYRIQDRRDRKVIAEYIPDFAEKNIAPKYHFWYYDYELEGAELYQPVEMPVKRENAVKMRKQVWI